MKKTLLLSCAAILFANQAKAVDVQPYVGADYIYSFADIEHQNAFKHRFNAFDLSFGVMATSTIGLEVFYQQSEQVKKASDLGQTKFDYKGYGLDGIYYLPVFESTQLLGSVGFGYYETRAKIKNGGFEHKEDTRFGLRMGLGAQYSIDENMALRFMTRYHYLHTDEINHMLDLSLGVRYYF